MSSHFHPRKPLEFSQDQDGSSLRSRSWEQERHLRPAIVNRTVVAVKGLTSSAKAEDLCEDKLLSGDIVEEVNVGGVILNAPFAGGKSGLQRELRRLYNTGDTVVQVKVRRGRGKVAELQVAIVPGDSVMLKKQYALRATHDTNHVVTFADSTEDECLALQESRCARLVSHLANTQLKDVSLPYSWEDKMHQLLPVRKSSMVFSLLVVPYAPDRAVPSYNDVEDTVARAMAWLSAAQASGVPVNFLNIQTEPLLTKVSGQQDSRCTVSAGSRDDLSSIINTGIYGFEDYHGIDIGVVRAVRLWYVPIVAEIAVVLRPEEGETRLGVGISRTDEGFCYVSSVDDGTVADRAGLKVLHEAARTAGRLLVISRVAEEKITPSMVSSSGSIRCFDTMSISHKLSMHRQACQPVRMHFMVWDGAVFALGWESSVEERGRATTRPTGRSNDLTKGAEREGQGASDYQDIYRDNGYEVASIESGSESSGSMGSIASTASRRVDRNSLGEFSFRTSKEYSRDNI